MFGLDPYLVLAIAFSGGVLITLLVWLILHQIHRRRHTDPQETRRRLLSGTYQILEGNYRKAAEIFSSVTKNDPDSDDVYFVLGRLFRLLGDYERAARIHKGIALHQRGTSGKVWQVATFELAEDYSAAKRADLAIGLLEELSAIAKDWMDPVRRLADLAMQMQDWDLAADALARVKKLGSGKTGEQLLHVQAKRIERFLETDNLAAARKLMKRVQVDKMVNAHLGLVAAKVLAKRGKGKKAIAELEAAIRANPQAARLLYPDYISLAMDFDLEGQAFDFLTAMLDSKPPFAHITRVYLAALHLKQGDEKEAAETVREILDAAIDLPELFECAKEMNLPVKGRAAYRCRNCNTEHGKPDWQCSHCYQWDTMLLNNDVKEN